MTVIAWDGKVLAADSRCSEDDVHLTNCRKIFKLKNGALLGTAGDDDDRDVRVLLAKCSPRKMPSRQQLADTKTDFTGLLVFPKGHLFVVTVEYLEREKSGGEWTACVSPVSDRMAAVGHGKDFAYGVMEHGGTAREAVRAACKRDLTCALPIQWATFEIEPQVDATPTPAPAPVVAKKPRKVVNKASRR